MSGFHGTWLKTVETADAIFTWTRFDCTGTLVPHTHAEPYASLVLQGSYTELRGFTPRWCRRGVAILHDRGEVHADHFHEPCIVVNAETKETGATGELLASALMQFHPSLIVATGRCNETAPSWVDDVCALLDADCYSTPGQAAALAGKHPADFSRAFRKYVGETPGSFQRRARIRRAARLLLASGIKIADVAQECGFSDQSHFTNAFVREAGMPPQRFAAAFAC